jgi:16S rRNA processing protein RimM
MALRYIGTICGTHGLNGAVHICDLLDAKITVKAKTEIYIGYSENYSQKYYLLKFVRKHKEAIATIEGINSDKEAKSLIEKGIFIDEKYVSESSEESYLIDDIIGCSVIDIETQKELGSIIDVWVLPANDVWLMSWNGKEIPIPVIDDVVKRVDLPNKRIFIKTIEGLLEII